MAQRRLNKYSQNGNGTKTGPFPWYCLSVATPAGPVQWLGEPEGGSVYRRRVMVPLSLPAGRQVLKFEAQKSQLARWCGETRWAGTVAAARWRPDPRQPLTWPLDAVLPSFLVIP